MIHTPYVLIGMNEYAITDGRDMNHILISVGAADCIIVAAFNERTSKLLMCHVTRVTEVRYLFGQITTITPSYYLLASDIFRENFAANGNYQAVFQQIPRGSVVRRIGSRNLEFDASTERFWTGELARVHARANFPNPSLEFPDIWFSRNISPHKVYPSYQIAKTSLKRGFSH